MVSGRRLMNSFIRFDFISAVTVSFMTRSGTR
jgi:hypothetical protein